MNFQGFFLQSYKVSKVEALKKRQWERKKGNNFPSFSSAWAFTLSILAGLSLRLAQIDLTWSGKSNLSDSLLLYVVVAYCVDGKGYWSVDMCSQFEIIWLSGFSKRDRQAG